MTNQEAFEKMAKHLLAQKQRSYNATPHGYCMYRGPNGLKCAVGALIPDNEYAPRLEGRSVDSYMVRNLPSLRGLDYEMLERVQQVHDHTPPENWIEELRFVAKRCNLDASFIVDPTDGTPST